MCPINYQLSVDGHKCIKPGAYLIFTQSNHNYLRRISLTVNGAALDSLQISGSNKNERIQPVAIDYHYAYKTLYWASVDMSGGEQSRIYRAFFNGSQPNVMLDSNIGVVEGIAVDWLSDNIYWSDWTQRHIEMAHLTHAGNRATHRRIIVWQNTHPRALTLHPIKG